MWLIMINCFEALIYFLYYEHGATGILDDKNIYKKS